jgi:hypothetical protein
VEGVKEVGVEEASSVMRSPVHESIKSISAMTRKKKVREYVRSRKSIASPIQNIQTMLYRLTAIVCTSRGILAQYIRLRLRARTVAEVNISILCWGGSL